MRRRVLVVGVVVALGVVVGLWWFWWVPSWRPPLREGERYGIDVSAHQAAVEWSAVAGDGIEFAYVKATEGGDFVDDRFAANWAAAGRAGLDVGAYHFFMCESRDIRRGRLKAWVLAATRSWAF